MEMCYDGALVMPSNYAVMSEEEMTYVEGGGTFRVKMNKAAIKFVAQAGAAMIFASITCAMGTTGIGAIVINGVANLLYSYILDHLSFPKAINKSWTKSWLPNYTFKWYK